MKIEKDTNNNDKYLYNNLLCLLNNKYTFNGELSSMTDDKIMRFSD